MAGPHSADGEAFGEVTHAVWESRGVSGASGDLPVERELNEIRLALLALLVGIGLTVGFGIDGSLCESVLD
jgi:hypothetical protein